MGLFDGVRFSPPTSPSQPVRDYASTAHIARLLNLPVLLAIDCSRLSGSAAAIACGYSSFDPRVKIAGLVLNRVGSDRHLQLLEDALEPLGLPILGIFRRQDPITLPERHLGLVPTAEIEGLEAIFDRLAELGKTGFNWERLLPLLASPERKGDLTKKCFLQTVSLASETREFPDNWDSDESTHRSVVGGRCGGGGSGGQSPPESLGSDKLVENQIKSSNLKSIHLEGKGDSIPAIPAPSTRIAIARDRAFSFYYPDNLDLLVQLGAELLPWSPMADTDLPTGTQGLYLGGGFPEVFARSLAENKKARRAVREAIERGMPTYAECGGLMYLCEQLIDFDGCAWPMVGVLPTSAILGQTLALGYRNAIAEQDSPAIASGMVVWGHEFHRSQLTANPAKPLFKIKSLQPQTPLSSEGWQTKQVHASYIHLHWGANPEIPKRFLQQCDRFSPPT